ncbi:MAG: MmcB family DNA repair protein [Kiloniellales bacterium]
MPQLSTPQDSPLLAMAPGQRLARGVTRMLTAEGWSVLSEVSLKNGRRADLLALSDKGDFLLVEVKSSLADFRSDSKWPHYLPFCDRFAFAVPEDFPLERLPPEPGLLIADPFGAAQVRPPPESRLAPARRRALQIRFARLAAQRLLTLTDPEANSAAFDL